MKAYASLALVVAAACAQPAPPTTTPAPPPSSPSAETTPAFSEPQQAWAGIRFAGESTRIALVIKNGPAAAGGVMAGDIVVSLDGKPASGAEQLVRAIRAHAVGDRIQLVLDRGGTQVNVTFVLGAKPDLVQIIKRELEGSPAPAFAPAILSGPHPAKLDDLRGNVVVLDFWASWCGPCQITMPVLEKWQAKYGAKGLRVVGVSNEPLEDINVFLAHHKFGYTIAHDADSSITQSFMVAGVPTLVVIDRKGIIRLVHLGADDLAAAEAAIVRAL
ncbi:MAG: redoxin family protein [Kofleriaceae bacterium]|nr:redoxin family protein [Kofleriaceae bacterium]